MPVLPSAIAGVRVEGVEMGWNVSLMSAIAPSGQYDFQQVIDVYYPKLEGLVLNSCSSQVLVANVPD